MGLKFDKLPEIIDAAAKSTLGIFALMIIVIGLLAYVFFKKSGDIVKVPIFILLFLGTAGFGFSLVKANNAIAGENKQDVPAKKDSVAAKPGPAVTPKRPATIIEPPPKHHARIGKQVLTIIINADFEGAALAVDGEPTTPDSTSLNSIIVSLVPGEHVVSLKNADKEFTRKVNIPSNHGLKLICE